MFFRFSLTPIHPPPIFFFLSLLVWRQHFQH
uniref:Uncharacterized protein n=1 Tax=Anguilla anguilla TaxID=7936 RepID=A0A0E9UN19_ANGAN